MLTREYQVLFQRWCYWKGAGNALRRGAYLQLSTREYLEAGAQDGLWTLFPSGENAVLTVKGRRYSTSIDVTDKTLGLVKEPHRKFRVVDIIETGQPDLKNFEFSYQIAEPAGVVSQGCETAPFESNGSIKRVKGEWRLQ